MTRPIGNPANRRRGAAVRTRLLALLRSGPVTVVAACSALGVSRTNLLNHLATLQLCGQIGGYTTEGGMMRADTTGQNAPGSRVGALYGAAGVGVSDEAETPCAANVEGL